MGNKSQKKYFLLFRRRRFDCLDVAPGILQALFITLSLYLFLLLSNKVSDFISKRYIAASARILNASALQMPFVYVWPSLSFFALRPDG
jgi:hypothetical protein